MKILLFGDLHLDLDCLKEVEIKANDAEIILSVGDFSIFGEGLREVLKIINSFEKPTYIIHGNHESSAEIKQAIKGLKNIKYIHRKIVKYEDIKIGGYGGDGFSLEDFEFEKFFKNKNPDIIITHGPPARTKLDSLHEEHVGNESYRTIIEKNQPKLYVCGHIHENFSVVDSLKKTIIINPGPEGILIDF